MTERKLDVLCYRELDWLIICLPYPSRFSEYTHKKYRYMKRYINLYILRNARYGLNSLFILSKTAAFFFPDFYVFDGWMIYSKIIGLNTKSISNYGYWFGKQSFLVPWCEFYDFKLCGNLSRSFYNNSSTGAKWLFS